MLPHWVLSTWPVVQVTATAQRVKEEDLASLRALVSVPEYRQSRPLVQRPAAASTPVDLVMPALPVAMAPALNRRLHRPLWFRSKYSTSLNRNTRQKPGI